MGETRIDEVLRRAQSGDAGAEGELFGLLYDDLHAAAGRIFRSQRRSHTLAPTALVHEAYLKMARPRAAAWKDRAHFLAVAARAMRQILVNHARDRGAAKRGGPDRGRRVTVDGVADAPGAELDVLDLHESLEALAALDARPARVAELRIFAGLEQREIAEALGVSLRTVELDWRMAKQFLASRLGGTEAGGTVPPRSS